jgi:hypothetical protein
MQVNPSPEPPPSCQAVASARRLMALAGPLAPGRRRLSAGGWRELSLEVRRQITFL